MLSFGEAFVTNGTDERLCYRIARLETIARNLTLDNSCGLTQGVTFN
jgi:hypothetical protein